MGWQGRGEGCKPVQLIVGTGDTVVPAQQSRDFQATLTAHGHPAANVELLEYPGQHMFFSDPNNIEHILANMVRIPVMRCPALWHTQSQPGPIPVFLQERFFNQHLR
jgi:dienelactone hydrolase